MTCGATYRAYQYDPLCLSCMYNVELQDLLDVDFGIRFIQIAQIPALIFFPEESEQLTLVKGRSLPRVGAPSVGRSHSGAGKQQ